MNKYTCRVSELIPEYKYKPKQNFSLVNVLQNCLNTGYILRT